MVWNIYIYIYRRFPATELRSQVLIPGFLAPQLYTYIESIIWSYKTFVFKSVFIYFHFSLWFLLSWCHVSILSFKIHLYRIFICACMHISPIVTLCYFSLVYNKPLHWSVVYFCLLKIKESFPQNRLYLFFQPRITVAVPLCNMSSFNTFDIYAPF